MNYIQILATITLALFFIKVLKDASYFLWLCQTKEYRIDRTKSHLKESLKVNVSDALVALGVLALLGIFFPSTASFMLIFIAIFLGLLSPLYFLYSFFQLIIDIKKHSLKRPKPTSKILLIIFFYFILYSGFIILITAETLRRISIIYTTDFFIFFSLYLLILDLLVPLFVLLAIMLVTPISNFQKRKIIKKAMLKMQAMEKVKTIGITGSFGKTSTKEFLYAILSSKYKVIKTEGNNNTAMGVANTVLKHADDSFDYFICEMGAYKIGEIKEISDIARPFAGIITGINEQHIDLFGSLQNIKKAKFELVQALPEDGFAVINKQAQEMAPKLEYKVKDVAIFSRDTVKDIKVQPDYIEFEYKEIVFRINILGKHYIENLLAAIITAEKLGMSLEDIQKAVSGIEIKSDYLMQKLQGPNGSIFIDDSYSANPSGVIAALEYLEDAYPKYKKIFVFPGIIELGKNSEKIHGKLWKKADDICSLVYVTHKKDPAITKKYNKSRFVFNKDFDKIKADLEKHLDGNTVVLFESRGAGVVMKKLLK